MDGGELLRVREWREIAISKNALNVNINVCKICTALFTAAGFVLLK